MIEWAVLGSGSSGNAYYISDGERAILIDQGYSVAELNRRLARLMTSMPFLLPTSTPIILGELESLVEGVLFRFTFLPTHSLKIIEQFIHWEFPVIKSPQSITVRLFKSER